MLWEWGVPPCQRDEKPLRKKFMRCPALDGYPDDLNMYPESPDWYTAATCEDRLFLPGRRGPMRDEDVWP